MVDVLNVIGWILLIVGYGVVWGFVGVFVSAIVSGLYDYIRGKQPRSESGEVLFALTFTLYTIVSGHILVFEVPL